ncbi:hypothetical protein L861_08960 [Litchfieldella anticariensis FP35 = DSM 16096]|uniref:Uncharacterized protein n=1 Tax=Litchfieldella anticariensis (strain DSM 16096 / CECT 5854 / CIP 108499 / LMG 22089 / FP35) TaxID=1121939 RepID=S2KKL3_LITA3|nr:hypothetical protein [Halomonas anticariensis]EPC02480.1 hypothetical protein L861_08960 [Halomonas anticariensis FP35 = DSM 16096]
MELFHFFQTSEFIAALFGVVAGFFFTLLSDVARSWVRRVNKRRQIRQEVEMIYSVSLKSLVVHIENDKIKRGSKESPLMCPSFDTTIIDDKDLMLDAGLSIEQRQILISLKNVVGGISIEFDKMNGKVLELSPKFGWEPMNTTLCHYFSFIIFNCEQYLGKIGVDLIEPLNGPQFRERNETLLLDIEKRYCLKIPRDIPVSSVVPG